MSPNLPRPKGPLPLPLESRPEERTRARSPPDLRRRRGPEASTARRSKENGTLSPPATGKKGSERKGGGRGTSVVRGDDLGGKEDGQEMGEEYRPSR